MGMVQLRKEQKEGVKMTKGPRPYVIEIRTGYFLIGDKEIEREVRYELFAASKIDALKKIIEKLESGEVK
jgi:hypothetical protein